MKILYITPAKLPSLAANAVHVMKMAQAMAMNGHHVSLGFQKSSSYSKDNIFELYGVNKLFQLAPFNFGQGYMGRSFFVVYMGFLSIFGKFNLVFSRCIPSAFMACLLRKDVLLELHDSPQSFGFISRWMIFKIFKMKSFKRLIVISQALKDHVVLISGIKQERVIVFHDGADDVSNGISPAPLCIQSIRYSYHVGYTGHLYKGRGIDLIIEVAKLLPHSFFHVVGGNPEDVEYWKKQSHIIENVHFYGHVPHRDVVRYAMAFDVLLAPYQAIVAVHGNKGNTAKWMSPLKIFEYMSTQKPIVCSDIPVLREVLNDELNAILCPSDDVSSWVRAIEKIKNDKIFAENLATNAKNDFLNNYTWRSRAKSILASLNDGL